MRNTANASSSLFTSEVTAKPKIVHSYNVINTSVFIEGAFFKRNVE